MTPGTMYKRTVVRSLVEDFQTSGKPKAILEGWEEYYVNIGSCINSINQTISRMGVGHITCVKENDKVVFINTIKY